MARRCAFVERCAFVLPAKPVARCAFVERCAFVLPAKPAETRDSDVKATTITLQNNLRIMMRLGANQSEIPTIREFARATAPVEFMVASSGKRPWTAI